jgi:hypothetical protein
MKSPCQRRAIPTQRRATPVSVMAFEQGTIVTTAGSDFPLSEPKHSSEGMGSVGASHRDANFAFANEMIRRAGLQAGDKVFFWGARQAWRVERSIAEDRRRPREDRFESRLPRTGSIGLGHGRSRRAFRRRPESQS